MIGGALLASFAVVAMLVPTSTSLGQPGKLSTNPAASNICRSATAASPNSGTLFGSLKALWPAGSSGYVMILPRTTLTEDYTTYLGSLGKAVAPASDASIETMSDEMIRNTKRLQGFSNITPLKRIAIVAPDGGFSCGDVTPGEYLIIASATPGATQLSGAAGSELYYAAVARVPVRKRNAKERLYSPVSRFVPASAVSNR